MNKDKNIVLDEEDIKFLEYQESVSKSREAKRNRIIMIFLATTIYLLGFGLFSNIAVNLYQIWPIAGIVVGITLMLLYTIGFVFVIADIYKKQSFDLEFKKRSNGVYSERKNNAIRWEIATNIVELKNSISNYYSKHEEEKFNKLEELVLKSGRRIPTYKDEESKELAKTLSELMSKNGAIYKKAKSIIWSESLACGGLTAVSQSAMVDAGIVVIKNLQLIKSIVWLYGFRPTDTEMNRIMFKVIKNVGLSIGLNTMPKGASFASKILNKESSNAWVQMLGSLLDMGAQFLGNGVMTYLIGKHTVSILLREYRVQDLFREQVSEIEDLEIEYNKDIFGELKEQLKPVKEEKKERIVLTETKNAESEANAKVTIRPSLIDKISDFFRKKKKVTDIG